jgi:hypothetical protein
MAASLAIVEDLAARRMLAADRMRAAFLTLRRNAQTWARGTVPAAGERFTFGPDPAVFQYFPGRGLAFHPLASFGRVNARARICLERLVEGRSGRERCRPRSLRYALDRLAGLAVRRSGFTAWEYLVPYGGGRPPWISAMAQATAIQALARGAKALRIRRWRSIAEHALGAFEQPAPTGVRVAIPRGTYYAMYPFAPTLRILNGSLQSLLGLYDHATLSGSTRARRLFRAAEPTAREAVIAHDTGSWSLYSRNGRPSPLNYHRLVVTQLAALCERLEQATYCDARRRFAGYEMRVRPSRHVVAWTARRIGRHRLILRAVGRGERATLTVRKRRPPGRKRVERSGSPPEGERGTRQERAEPTPPAHATPVPAPPAAPVVTSTPDSAATPEATTTPDSAATPEVTITPDATPTPDSQAAPEPTAGAEPTTRPDATATPEADATPETPTPPEATSSPGAASSPPDGS